MRKDLLDMTLTMQAESAQRLITGKLPLPLYEEVKMLVGALYPAAPVALRVAASRQVNEGGNWVEAPVQAATVQKLEDIILTKARDLRRQASSVD